MSSVRAHKGKLMFDFRYRGQRCREYTKLSDTAANRKKMKVAMDRIDGEISLGTFDYGITFPGSKLAEQFAEQDAATLVRGRPAVAAGSTPLFKDFVDIWLTESLPGWRRSHLATVRSTLDRHLIPAFGECEVGQISKADVLQFRARMAKLPGRGGNASLSSKTLNRTIQILGQILTEAADRYEFSNPVDRIKRLKQQRTDIHPFSMNEVRLLIATIREDYRDYLTVRFFTGMRTGEIHGLKWKYVDFERRQILIRETIVRGEIDYTKTDGSQREIHMSQPVFEALKRQQAATGSHDFVFCNREGEPLDTDNFTNRVWYPLLRHLDLDLRRPYQTRHTCATLWLAAGENPEWVARQLGHANTMMLFKTYSRFVPNLTRRDGSAFERLVTGAMQPEATVAA